MGQVIGNAVELALPGSWSWRRRAAAPTRHPHPAGAGGCLRAGSRRGAQRPLDGRPAGCLPGGGARLLAAHERRARSRAGLTVEQLAHFAELVFAYIDQLSASSVAGHSDELATTGRVRERYLERLAGLLLAGRRCAELTAAAERADWAPPRTLTAVILPEARCAGCWSRWTAARCGPTEACPAGRDTDLVVLLVPDAERPVPAGADALARRAGRRRRPSPPVDDVQASYARACRRAQLGLTADGTVPLDTERRLADLVLRADAEALADLRARMLAPLDDLDAGGAGEAGGDAARRGCCTTDGGSRSPPRCSCTPRPCATAWGSCASSTGSGWRTRARCSN